MVILQVLMYPFAALFNFVTSLRNWMYDQGFKPSIKFQIPVIGIGNLSAGGTGKTPLTEYLIRLLALDHKVATLSRGYGRKTKGFRIAQPADTASTLGDEPYQFYQNFGGDITVAVGEERALAIPTILQERAETEIILLDDAYQHRSVAPSFTILLSDYYRPFYKDLLLPAGRLRESRMGAERADVVVVTKCPMEMSEEEMIEIEKSIREYAEKPVFFTHVRYGNPIAFGGHSLPISKQILLVSGISNAKPFEHHVAQNYQVKRHFHFRDHHAYSGADIERIARFVKQNPRISILTTEKDKVKLAAAEFSALTQTLPLFYIPIEVQFIKNGQDFDEIVLNSLKDAG